PVFAGVLDAVEEALLNSLFTAVTTTGVGVSYQSRGSPPGGGRAPGGGGTADGPAVRLIHCRRTAVTDGRQSC
ncbi:hypothetical protein, partial [Micromonospora sp. b486]|uniref:hypothetical protein n=1 Tax=Micromonospora sp. b486 TaxID=3053986 RepID=UPI00259CECB6